MSAQSRRACESCQHPGAFHVLPIGACRRNGCSCLSFKDPEKPRADEADEERTLVVRIPAGYFATVSVYPMDDDGS